MYIKIALIQEHTTPDPEVNLQIAIAAIEKAAKADANLAAFAELSFLPFFPQEKRNGQPIQYAETIPGPTTDKLCALAKEHGMVIIPNLFEEAGGNYYDASPVIDSDGTIKEVARMMHIMDGPGFRERDYYHPGDRGACVCDTTAGRIGVAICYDRHYPEYMRALGVKGAQLVVVPQAGAIGEWAEGLYEAELQVAALQNGYFTALVNRVGKDGNLHFAGESFVTDPHGAIITQAPKNEDGTLYADLDLNQITESHAYKHFLPDRRPDQYPLA